MIVNDDSRVVNKLEASLTDDTRVVIYNCQIFIVQVTPFIVGINPGWESGKLINQQLDEIAKQLQVDEIESWWNRNLM